MTLDFVPVALYSSIYYLFMILVLCLTLIHTLSAKMGSKANMAYMRVIGGLLFFFVLLYIGLRPVDDVFVDMSSYSWIFYQYKSGIYESGIRDPLFNALIYASSKIVNVNGFFLLCAAIYIFPIYIVSKIYFKKYWVYSFLMLVCSFSFWGYGVNGIRNGLATSIFLLGISSKSRLLQLLWIIISIGMHKSMILPAAGFLVTNFINVPRYYIGFWLFCIPISLAFGDLISVFFASIGFDDDRMAYLTIKADSTDFSSTGFRWDFLLYSSVAVFAGWFYIYRKKFEDIMYARIFNTFVFSNALWVLVIGANFSNRFAYLSWFMIGLVVIYPFLKFNFTSHQHIKIALILLANILLTYMLST